MKTVVSLNVPRLLCTSSKHQSKPISDIPVEKTEGRQEMKLLNILPATYNCKQRITVKLSTEKLETGRLKTAFLPEQNRFYYQYQLFSAKGWGCTAQFLHSSVLSLHPLRYPSQH